MSVFNEANSVRDLIRDEVVKLGATSISGADLDRETKDVLLTGWVRDALARLNPDIADDPDKAEQVLYQLNGIVREARQNPHPITQNEEFMSWLLEGKSLPLGEDGEHVTIRFFDFDDPAANEWIVSTEVTFARKQVSKRFDLVIWCNGFPLVVGEAKNPTRPSESWMDGAAQIHDDYEQTVAPFFVPNVFVFATEGRGLRYGSVGMPIEKWGPWRDETAAGGHPKSGIAAVQEAVRGLLNPVSVLEFLRFFTTFATDKKHRKIKIIARFQQFQGANAIVERVREGTVKTGLIWHFQGSGKSLLMLFASLKLKSLPEAKNPTILIIVDRTDLDTQITGTFNASDVAGLVSTDSRVELQELLRAGARKIIVTTIQKFQDVKVDATPPDVWDDRHNIIALVDEAHRTQEGDLGARLRTALPNAFRFGLTGTPINKRDRNTFALFGHPGDEGGYLSKYSFQDSIRDGATLPLHFEVRPSSMKIDQDAIDTAFAELADSEDLSEKERADLSKRAASIERLIKAPNRIRMIAEDIAEHFTTKVEPEGFKAQVVAYDKEACVAYKTALDKILDPEISTIVMSKSRDSNPEWAKWEPTPDEQKVIVDRFNDPSDPLKILIVTAKLLTGFDAPILYCQYLDKTLKEHTLLQAICRTNRVYPPRKTHGLIVDYLGVFDDTMKSLDFDEKSVRRVITNLDELEGQLEPAMRDALGFFPGVDRTIHGYEGLIAAQQALADDETKDEFAGAYSVVSQLFEALSPRPVVNPYRADFVWLTDVYRSVKPPDNTGRLRWIALGPKTLEIINSNIQVEIPAKTETIVLNADTIEDYLSGHRSDIDAEEIAKAITARIAKHRGNPKFVALGKRLNALREKYSDLQQANLDFLRELLELAKDTVAAENEIEELPPEELGKAALTELFEAVKTEETPIIVENVVHEIDEVVRATRFTGWQGTHEGEREVQKALRRTLYIKFKIRDADVFDKAYSYVREYY